MIQQNIIVSIRSGLHARPASILAKACKQFKSEIHIIFNGKPIKAVSAMGLLTAGIKFNSLITLQCNGIDENEAMKKIASLFENELPLH